MSENASGGEPTPFWADNMKYLNLISTEDFSITIEAYLYPAQFRACLGKKKLAEGLYISQQTRQSFGFSYRTYVGNAEKGNDYSYKIHLVYGCLASPTEESNNTINDSPDLKTLSWEISTTPEVIEGFKPTSHFIFDGVKYKNAGLMNVLRAIEEILYGLDDDVYILDSSGQNILDSDKEPIKSEGTDSRLPTLAEIRNLYDTVAFCGDSDDDMILDSSNQKIRSFVAD